MNLKIVFAVATLTTEAALSQIVVTVPQFPTENDSIVVTFDATQPGASELLNYTGTLYTHTGVITNLSTGPSDWKYVKGTWGSPSQPTLTRLGENLYRLIIGRPRQYYGVSNQTERILKLAFVFRSADGTKQTRPDIFVDLFEPGISVLIDKPEVSIPFGDPLRSPVFAGQDDTIAVRFLAAELGTKISTLTLFINGLQVLQSDSSSLVYDFISSAHSIGANTLTAIGIDTSGIADTAGFVVFTNPPVEDAPLPQGADHGINNIDNTTITLALFAPYKDFVYVIGDFNDWKIDTLYFMKRHQINPDSIVWWTTINGLTPGQEYSFQYLVDGTLRIGDPYSEKVLDPWNDQDISSVTYPGLKPYPAGKTAEPVSVLQTNQMSYAWSVTDFHRPAKTDLVIYEILLRDFLSTHSFTTLTDTLNYLKSLGVNAIELMPVMEFEGNESWGYNPSFHLALDKYYGPADEFDRFVDSAHAKGMAVILDIVLNHAFGQSPLVRLYWDAENKRPAPNNPWFNPVARHPFNVGYDFNHESPATQRYVDRVTRHWLTRHKVDGFRFDLSKGFTQTNSGTDVAAWGAYDQSRIDLLKRIADRIWEIDSTAYVILEHFADNSEESVLSNYGMMLWGKLTNEYNEATMGWHDNNKSNFSWGSYRARGWTDPNLVTYMESHDEERLMYKNLMYGNSSGTYDVKNIGTALERMKLAAAFFFTIPGPKMLWQFGELGYDISINYNGRLGNKPIRWDYHADPARRNLFKVISALTTLKQYDAFRTTDFSMSVGDATKRITLRHASMDVTIIGNFDVVAQDVHPDFSKTGTWYDYFSGDSLEVSDTQALRTIRPGEFQIYTSIQLPTPEPGIVTGAEENRPPVPRTFHLHQNYPNPFNPSTRILFEIPSAGMVTLKIYSILGEEVAVLEEGNRAAGPHAVEWDGRTNDGRSMAAGVYFARLSVGEYSETIKMLLLR
ncbi:MAG: hypothetical protein HBSIN02_04160 [Bacteroidia bacterium]|nr:MAG: hypothetical protein HBSIN02_04160 [Bacteroidia bacterium]